jgi:prepilin-type N-terminal cleavage/methylation domain-containing protein/prepilin-type processing-associated H-X9-DG protein
MKKKAFTLIELLVVIAIIAVLMGILMPSLRAARDQAKRVHCVSNVKTLSLGWVMYAENNDNKLVGGHTDPGNWVLRADASMTVEQKKQTIRDGLLFPYVGKEVNVYRCPADNRLQDIAFNTFRSFSIPGGANGEGSGGCTVAKSLLDIKRPSEKYVFVEDIDPRGANVGSWIMSFNPIHWIDPLAMWHNERSTLGFADGHAEMHRWEDPSFIKWAKSAMYSADNAWPGFNMQHPATETTDIKWMANGYPCKNYQGRI